MTCPVKNPALHVGDQKPNQPSPRDRIARIAQIENEAQSIWHITELLSKLGSSSEGASEDSPDICYDTKVTLTTATIRHVAQQISNHVSNIVENVEWLEER